MATTSEHPAREGPLALIGAGTRAGLMPELDTEQYRKLVEQAGGIPHPEATEALLRKREERFRNLTAAAFEGIGINEGGKVVDVNEQLAQMFGYTREELIGQEVSIMIAPESRLAVDAAIKAGYEGPYEHLAIRKDGTIFDAEVRAKTIMWDGRLVRVSAIRDITERKQAAQAMRRQLGFNEVLNKVLSRFATSAAPNADAAVVGALQAIAEFIGADHAFLVLLSAEGATWSATHEWCAPHVPAQFDAHQEVPLGTKPWCEAQVKAGEIIRLNTLADYPPQARSERQRDTNEGALSVLSVPIRGSAGKVTGCVGLHAHAHPITWADGDVDRLKMVGDAIASLLERKRAEEALRESEERYRAVVEFSPETIAVAVDERFVYVNPAGAKLVGAAGPEGQASLIGRSVYDFVPASQREQVRTRRRRVLERDVTLSPIESPLTRLDGSSVFVEGYNIPFVYGGKPAVLSLLRDVTARKRAEQSLRALSHRLHRAEDGERRRIARELHDSTAQQLVAVLMNLGMLKDLALGPNDKMRKLLHESVSLVECCSDEVRTLSYLLHPPLLDQMGLEPALRMYLEGFSKRSGIKLALELANGEGRLPEEIELTLFRVVQEGLGNIYRHSGSRTARIWLAREADRVILEVSDQGLGIPTETLQAIQNGLSTQGVGLAAMQERVREVGGRLEVESTGAGTKLRTVIPLAEDNSSRLCAA